MSAGLRRVAALPGGSLLPRGALEAAAGGRSFGCEGREPFFSSVATDSRAVTEGSLFVPLVGERQDGHLYIPEAIEKGASVVFVERGEAERSREKYSALSKKYPRVLFVETAGNLRALQGAAERYLERFPRLLKIAVTGSCGKTTTKDMIAAVLRQKLNVASSEGNLNSETGVPLSAFKVDESREAAVFEMGMNRENEIGESARVVKPQFAVITNIGTAHIGMLGSRENIAREKRKIASYIPSDGALFLREGEEFFSFLSEGAKGRVIPFGSAEGAARADAKGFESAVVDVGEFKARLNFAGGGNYENAAAAVAVGRYFGVDDESIARALEGVKAAPMRGETMRVELKNGKRATIVVDCYNANPDSMAKAIEMAERTDAAFRIYVLGEMLELGEESEVAHRKMGEILSRAKNRAAALLGERMGQAALAVEDKADVFYSADLGDDGIARAAEFVLSRAKDGSLVLLKGSRAARLERLVPLIVEKGAEESN